jgi:hypothetical protein
MVPDGCPRLEISKCPKQLEKLATPKQTLNPLK